MVGTESLTLLMVVTIAVGTTAAFLAWRKRSEPGAMPLVAMFLGQSWWAAFFVFELQATTLEAKLLWSDVQWVGVVVIPLAWLLFALEYTGRDQYVRPQYLLVLAVVPVVTVVLALTGGYHDLLYTGSRLVEQNGTAMLDRSGGPWYWVVTAYTYVLGGLGAVPMLGLVRKNAFPFRGQSAAILVGTVTPGAVNALFLAGVVPLPSFDPTPVAFTVSGVAFLGAISRFRLFGTNPAPNQSARRLVFERMQEAAVVVDGNDHVVDANENARDVFPVPPEEALGRPAREVVPEYDRLPEEGAAADHVTVHTDVGTRFYDVTVTPIGNVHGHTIGRVVIFHDVGEYLRQQQRLEVLNRALRHNIRTETNIICGYAGLLDGDEHITEVIREHALRIDEMGEKAREIADIFARDQGTPEAVSLDAVLRGAVASVREEHPDVTVEYDPPLRDVTVARVLDPALSNVVENAAEHNASADPHVWVSAEADGDQVRVDVADDGPGIGEEERAVLERGTETQLEHGSGLGLWLITWGTAIADGRVTFSENDPTGSVVTVEAPVLSQSEERPDAETRVEAAT